MARGERLSWLHSDDTWRNAVIGAIVALGIILYTFEARGGLSEPIEIIGSFPIIFLGGLIAGVLHEGRAGVAGRRAGLIAVAPAALWSEAQIASFLVSGSVSPVVGVIFLGMNIVVLAVFVPLAMLVGKIGGGIGNRVVLRSTRKFGSLVGA